MGVVSGRGCVLAWSWCYQPVYCGDWFDDSWVGSGGVGFLPTITKGKTMMDLRTDGRDVCVTLKDDVWQLEEPGTLCLTRDQVYYLRAHLNGLHDMVAGFDGEDG